MTTNNEATTGGRDDEQAIRRLTEDWLAAVKTKDTTRLEQMVTEDAVFLPPGHPPFEGNRRGKSVQLFLPAIRQRRADGIHPSKYRWLATGHTPGFREICLRPAARRSNWKAE